MYPTVMSLAKFPTDSRRYYIEESPVSLIRNMCDENKRPDPLAVANGVY